MYRYLFSGVLFAALAIALPIGLKLLLSQYYWQADDWLYPFLNFANNNLVPLIIATIVVIWCLISYLFIRRAVNYLEEAFQASRQLTEHPEQPIELSSDLGEFEAELNRVRQETLFQRQAAADAEQKKNDLIVYLAHDLRTPLTSIIGYLTLLAETPELPTETRAKYIGITLEKAYRLEGLIGEFFEITRFNLSSIELTTHQTDLSLMVEQLSYEFKPALAEKGLTWQSTITPNLLAELDTDKFERVLDNLFKNAVNYADANTVLQLELEKQGNHALMVLTNQGHHIPPEKLARIFEPFFRADSARTSRTGGTGLGLPIAKQIVELHGGKLAAESVGNQFSLTMVLPLLVADNQKNP